MFHINRIVAAFEREHLDTEAQAIREMMEELEAHEQHRKSWEGIVDGNAQ